MQSHMIFFILAVKIIPVVCKNLAMLFSFSLSKMFALHLRVSV